MTLTAAQMRSLPACFQNLDDPRRREGRRHALPTVLALAAAATVCGMRGYKAMSEWVDDLNPKVLQRFGVRRRDGRHCPPSLSAMRRLLIRVDPAQFDAALRAWHEAHGSGDRALAIDGKTIRGAIDDDGKQAHVAGHRRPRHQGALGAKKVGIRAGADDAEKRTNEIGTVIPLLETVPDIAGRTVTADALLTQRALASWLLDHGVFTVKGNQPTLLSDIRLVLDAHTTRRAPDFTDHSPKPEHGRRERRSLWVSSELNDYLDFPGVGQVFAVRRETVEVKSGKQRCEIAYGVTSLTSEVASPERLLALNRGHWTIEATRHILDWELRRGSQPHPLRPRAGEHDTAPALRHRRHQGARARRRPDHAQSRQKPEAGARLPQNDRQRRPQASAPLTALRLASIASPPTLGTPGRAVMPG